MGQGGFFKLINNTPFAMKKTGEHSYQMNAWNLPQQVNPHESLSTYVEFSEGVGETWHNDAGESDYVLSGSNDGTGSEYRFQVQVRFRYINVDIKNMAGRVLPAPIPPQSSLIALGWNHDGEVSFSLADVSQRHQRHGVASNLSVQQVRRHPTRDEARIICAEFTRRINDGEFHQAEIGRRRLQELAAEMFPERNLLMPSESGAAADATQNPERRLGREETYWLRSWMWQYQQFLGAQKFTSLILPGTHDSGTYDMVSVIAEPWTQCQNLDLKGQLEMGARALDIRTGVQASESGNEKFILVHEEWRSRTTMASALDQVMGFCNENRGEIVVLDYHRFTDLDGGATARDYQDLIALIRARLGDKLIPSSNRDKTYNELVAGSGRVIVAWNRDDGPGDFWPSIDQKWFNKSTQPELFGALEAFYLGQMPPGMWACCAVITPDFPNIDPIQSLDPHLSLWFAPDGSWSQMSNIVYCDFIETTQLPQALVQANIFKVT